MPTTTTIVFRGLMIFNYQQDAAGKNYMEIGFLDARTVAPDEHSHPGHTAEHSIHIPRILTMTNGILASVFDLRKLDELGVVRDWELVVTDSSQTDVTLNGSDDLDRTKDPTSATEKNFRWITDLEGPDMHKGDLKKDIGTRNLLLVLTVRHGEFSTKMISPKLDKIDVATSAQVPYGFAAAVTGCEITFNGNIPVKLMAGSVAKPAFEFTVTPNTIFEISNSPPDVPTDAPIAIGEGSHFHMYYDKLFIKRPPPVQFDFVESGGAPSPDPALCGVTYLSQRNDPL